MEKEYLSKKELENKLKLTKEKYHKISGIDDCILKVCGGAVIVSAIIMGVSAALTFHVHVGYMVAFLTSLCAIPASGKHFNKKLNKLREQYINTKNQLEDIVSIDFEKKRYALEKKYSNTTTNNDLIKSIQEEKELLEKYKKDLNQYCINRVDDELTNEINTRNYTLQKLNQLK